MSNKNTDRVHSGLNLLSNGVPPKETPGSNNLQGVHLAIVVDFADPDYNGHIWVEIIGQHRVTSKNTQEERHRYNKIRPINPMGGTINDEDFSIPYGASFPPPGIGTEVLVAFAANQQEGFLIGALTPAGRNSSIPGLAANPVKGEEDVIAPTLDSNGSEAQKNNAKVRHPSAEAIALQGIALDPVRGVGSSGARRESPSNVSGFNTPGGHGLVMDDGTVEYTEDANHVPDQARESGKNNLIRLRSAGGAQILLNDSAGIVYIMSQTGKSWIQMDADGNVDVFAEGSISYRAEDSINFYADDSFNIEASTVNIKATGADGIKFESSAGGIDMFSQKELKLHTEVDGHISARGNLNMTTSGNIELNSPGSPASVADKPTSEPLPINRVVKESINGRVPEHEPWGGHRANDSIIAAQAPSTLTPTQDDYDVS